MILQDYFIPFSGLKEGLYKYEFQAEDLFFEHYDNPDIRGGSIRIHLKLLKKNNFLELHFNITGILRLVCDRCLDEFDTYVETDEILFVRFGDAYEELSDNVIVIPAGENRLNIAQFIYEFSVLSLPIKKVHPLDINGNHTCNAEMLEILKKHSSENAAINPVWDNLKNIIN